MKKKLKLSSQTIRLLTTAQLAHHVGGASGNYYCVETHNGCGASQGPGCYPTPTGGWGCNLPPIPPPPPSFGPPAQCWP